MPPWRVSINDDCIGSAMCVALAPAYFALGDDGKSHPIRPLVDPDEVLRDAEASCPMEAITVRDQGSSLLPS